MQAQPKEFKVRSVILDSESISIVTYLKSILCRVLIIKVSDVIEKKT